MAFYKYSTFTKLLSEKRFLAQLIKFGTCIDPNLGFISVDNFKDQAELSKTFKFIVAYINRVAKANGDKNRNAMQMYKQKQVIQNFSRFLSESDDELEVDDFESDIESNEDSEWFWKDDPEYYAETIEKIVSKDKRTSFVLLYLVARLVRRRRTNKNPKALLMDLKNTLLKLKFDFDNYTLRTLKAMVIDNKDVNDDTINRILAKFMVLSLNLNPNVIDDVYTELRDFE